MREIPTCSDLAALLNRRSAGILTAWTNRVRSMPDSHYRQRSREEVRSWLAGGLTAVAKAFAGGTADPLALHVKEVSRVRGRLGFDISEVIEALLQLKEVALPFVLDEYAGDMKRTGEVIHALDLVLRTMIGMFASLYAQGMLQTQEAEDRQKIAQDLHDSVTQSLYGLTLHAEAAKRQLDEGNTEGTGAHLGELQNAALDALKEMRLLIFELRPRALEKEGLAAALRARLAAVEGRAGLTTEFTSELAGRLPSNIEKGLHGIAQEALNNILKHARASQISVRLKPSSLGVILQIEDNGHGFSVAEGRDRGGLGLRGMEERAAEISARFSVWSEPGKGTRITVSVPVP